jgi:trimethylamine---corrinoid protein Co-methyltransferase
MAKALVTYLTPEEKAAIDEQVMDVLENVGVAYNSPLVLDLLEQAGAPVDRESLRARLPRALVRECLAQAPRRVLLAGRDPARDVWLGDGRLVTTSDGSATFVVDERTGLRSEGTLAELHRYMRLLDALDEIDILWSTVSARDLDPVTAILRIQATCFDASGKHEQDGVRHPDFVAPLVDILQAIAGAPLDRRPIFSAIVCTVAPLQHDGPMTEAALALVRRGVPIFILPMPLMGTTAPMSLAGTCVVHLAELLSAIVPLQLASPGCPVVSCSTATVADMRSGGYLCGAPEKALINAALTEMAKFYGLPTQSDGVGADATWPDLQAGVEGLGAALAPVWAGVDSLIAAGCLDGVQVASHAKAVLDNDTVGYIRRISASDSFAASETLAEEIAAVGIGGHFLGRRSTRTRMHERVVWQPGLYRRGPSPGRRDGALVEEALERAEALLAERRTPPLDEDVQRHIDDVTSRFAQLKHQAGAVA